MSYRRLRLPGGSVELFVGGPADARDLLLFHVGTPSAAVMYPGLVREASARGLRVATYSRPGYGRSERRAGRTVADEATISAQVADALGHPDFFVAGWSGGGPAALACAALLPQRVRACLVLAGIMPRIEAGSEWERHVPPEELPEWQSLASGDVTGLIPEYEILANTFRHMTLRRLAAVGGPPDDRARRLDLDRDVQVALVRSMRRAFLLGLFGYLDDAVAQARDWGFRVADIRVPVVIRHGERDRLVPVANGLWLAGAIPGARATILPDAGHGSVVLPWSDVVGALLEPPA